MVVTCTDSRVEVRFPRCRVKVPGTQDVGLGMQGVGFRGFGCSFEELVGFFRF